MSSQSVISGVKPDATVFGFDMPQFRKNFDEKPFEFRHVIDSEHPLFTRERMRHLLTNPEMKKNIYYNAGEIRVDQRWDSVPARTKPVEEVFDSVDNSGAWIALLRVNEDPEYNSLLEDCLMELKKLSGRAIDDDKKTQEADIYITSPGRVTMYHIDPICNFLMQISGEKQIHIFDRQDRDVLPEAELERYWSLNDYSVTYPRELEHRAEVFTLRPGTGVHIPVNNPHWVKNGNNISISLSINYQYKDDRRKNIYQANYYLRRAGLKPKPPGSSRIIDHMKASAVTVSRKIDRRLKTMKLTKRSGAPV
jgi:Cupin-like domain